MSEHDEDEAMMPLGDLLSAVRFGVLSVKRDDAAWAEAQGKGAIAAAEVAMQRADRVLRVVVAHLVTAHRSAIDRLAAARELDIDDLIAPEQECVAMLDQELRHARIVLAEHKAMHAAFHKTASGGR